VIEKKYQRAVENGVIRQFSVSQAKMFLGCRRKWHFNKVQGKKTEDTAAAKKGGAGHKRIEVYLETGKDVLDRFERVGLQYMPIPGPDLMIEEPFGEEGDKSLTADGVPFMGKIDVVNPRPLVNRVLKLTDWKFSNDPRQWAAKAEHLGNTKEEAGIQMIGYAKWARNVTAKYGWEFDRVELEHVYFALKGRPDSFVVRQVVEVDKVESEWQFVDSLLREAKDVAKESDWQKVPATTDEDECRKFGGCPFFTECKGGITAIAKAKTTNQGKQTWAFLAASQPT
jgi:hypothetical protein